MFSDNVTCLVRDRIRCRCRWGSPRPARRRTLGIDVALNRISTDTQLPCHRSNGHALKLGLLHSVPPSLLKKRRLPPPKAQPCSPCPTRLYPYSIPAPRCFATRPSGKPKSCWSARYWLPGQQWNGLCPAGADIGGHLAVDHGTPPRAAVVTTRSISRKPGGGAGCQQSLTHPRVQIQVAMALHGLHQMG